MRDDDRKGTPLYSGVNRYFPAALEGVARVSVAGSRQHHGCDELFDDRTKSVDDADALLRHLHDSEIGDGMDGDVPHIDKVAWRALRMAQKWHERHAAPRAPAALNGGPLVGKPIPPNYDPDDVAFAPSEVPIGWWRNESEVEIADPPPDEVGDDPSPVLTDTADHPHPAGIGDVPVCELTPQQRMECVLNWGFVPGDGNNLDDWMDFVDTAHKTMSAPEYELDELRAERSGQPWNAQVIAHGSGAGDYGDPIAPRGTP